MSNALDKFFGYDKKFDGEVLKEGKANVDLEYVYIMKIKDKMLVLLKDGGFGISHNKLLFFISSLKFLLERDPFNNLYLEPLGHINSYVYRKMDVFIGCEDGLRVVDKLVRLNRYLLEQLKLKLEGIL